MTQEMVWLGDALAHSMTEMGTTLQEAIALARTVADQHGVGLELSLSDASTTVAVAQTVLKQIVLNLLTTAIHMAPAGQVTVQAQAGNQDVCIQVIARAAAGQALVDASQDGVDMAAKLAALFGGTLTASREREQLVIAFRVPKANQVVVLAIEDNADTLRLWERYAQDTRRVSHP